VKSFERVQVGAQPLALVPSQGYYLVLDAGGRVHLVAQDDLSIKKRVNGLSEEATPQPKTMVLLGNGVVGYAQGHHYVLRSFINPEKFEKSFGWQIRTAKLAAVSERAKLLAVAVSKEGVNLYRTDGTLYACVPHSRADYSAMCFDETGRFLAVRGGNSFSIYDIATHRIILKHACEFPIVDLFFYEMGKIAVLLNDGGVLKVDLVLEKAERIGKFSFDPKCAVFHSSRHTLIATSTEGVLGAFDMDAREVLFAQAIAKRSFSFLHIEDKRLFAGFSDGGIRVYWFDTGLERLKEALNDENMRAGYEIVKSNFLLLTDRDIRAHLHQFWDEVMVPESYRYAAAGDNGGLLARAGVLMLMPSYKKRLQKTFQMRKHILAFNEACETAIVKAYSQARQNTLLRESPAFKNLEARYAEAVERSVDAVRRGDVLSAQRLLTPFSVIREKKDAIDHLIKAPESYLRAYDALLNDRMDLFFRTVREFGYLKNSLLYERFEREAKDLIRDLECAEEEGDIKEMQRIAKRLAKYQPYRKIAHRTIEKLKQFQKMAQSISQGLEEAVLESGMKYRYLAFSEPFLDFVRRYERVFETAHEHASRGESEEAFQQIVTIMEHHYLIDRCAMVMQIGYLQSMLNIEDKHTIDWNATLDHYSMSFGLNHLSEYVSETLGVQRNHDRFQGRFESRGYVDRFPLVDAVLKPHYEIEEEEVEKEISPQKIMMLAGVLFFIGVVGVIVFIFWDGVSEEYKLRRNLDSPVRFDKLKPQQKNSDEPGWDQKRESVEKAFGSN